VPWPDSLELPAGRVAAMVRSILDPMIGERLDTMSLPDLTNERLLSAKVMPNGDLNVYLQPPPD
jgi:hypothetical protein